MTSLLDTHTVWLNWTGMETDLIFNAGVDLPEFAAFPLMETADGRARLTQYFADFCVIGATSGAGVILESCTWMASIERGGVLGYDAAALAEVNRRAVALMEPHRRAGVLLSGDIGPRGDAYEAGTSSRAGYADYHAAQVQALADTSADLSTGMTIPSVAEAAGICDAVRDTGKPLVISFVIETDGRLPDGTPLMDAIAECDAATGAQPIYYMVNCAHPDHMAPAFAGDVSDRLRGAIANASRCSHAELDEAEVLDDGDPQELGGQLAALRARHAPLAVLGGCCGTDLRHIARIAQAAA